MSLCILSMISLKCGSCSISEDRTMWYRNLLIKEYIYKYTVMFAEDVKT
jgi:hypothetical protein